MLTLRHKIAIKIVSVSFLAALITAPLAWWHSRHSDFEFVMSSISEDANRLLSQHDDKNGFVGERAAERAQGFGQLMITGLADAAKIYNAQGQLLAIATNYSGSQATALLGKQLQEPLNQSHYKLNVLPSGEWALAVTVPLQVQSPSGNITTIGYVNAIRVVSDLRRQAINRDALWAAVMILVASMVIGLMLYPIIIRLINENTLKSKEISDSHILMMEALGRAVARRDASTGAHNYRVAWFAALLAERLGIQGQEMQSLIAGSLLHDIGKIAVPDSILLKPTTLTDDEMTTMRTHVTEGSQIVSGMGWLEGAKEVVCGHHEKWDGSGYPEKLSGQAIPLSARIFAVADVFDALISKRHYKEPYSFERVMQIMDKGAGHHFDPAIIQIFRPLAQATYDRLILINEDSARGLFEELLAKYFVVHIKA